MDRHEGRVGRERGELAVRLLLPWALALSAAACDSGGAAPAVVVQDSSGVEVVETRRPMWGEGEPWEVSAEPVLTIGGGDGDAASEFHQIRGATRLDDGRIVVADGGSNTVRYFDAHGEPLQTVGGSGDGPGEFRRLHS